MEIIRNKLKMNKLDKAFKLKVEWIKEECGKELFDSIDEANFEGSDKRSAKAFAEIIRPKEEIRQNCKNMMKSFAIDGETDEELGMITLGPVIAHSVCPHHLLPVSYEVYVSYVPQKGKNAKVLGLSKLARLAKEVCKYPMLQESYAKNLADVLYKGNDWLEGVGSAGSAVQVVGIHNCIACRGVESDSLTVTTEIRGCYKNNDLEEKFYKQIEAARISKIRG